MGTLRSQKLNLCLAVIILLMLISAFGSVSGCTKKKTLAKKRPPATSKKNGPLIRIGVVPAISTIETAEQFQPLMDYLSEKLKAPVKLVILADYDSIIKQMESGELEGGIHGSFSALVVQKKIGAIPLARPEKNGVSTYRGFIFTRKDTGIETVADLRGKSFMYTDIKTSAGYVYPVFLLTQMGYDPAKFFRQVSFAGRQDLAVLAVLNGDADAGAAKDTTYYDLAQKNPRIDVEMLILNSSLAKFPEKSVVVRSDLDPSLIERLKRTLLGMDKNPDGIEAFLQEKIPNYDEFVKKVVNEFKGELKEDMGITK